MPPNTSNTGGYDRKAKASGSRHFKHFLKCYGLKLHNPKDVEEGKDILDAMSPN